MQSALDGSWNMGGSGPQGPSETTGIAAWPTLQMGARRKKTGHSRKARGGASEPQVFETSGKNTLPTYVVRGPPLAAPSLLASRHPELATLAMVLASSLYAESSVEELDWPTCWGRKQQKKALKMFRPRGFLGEDLDTRPRAEGMMRH